MDFFDFFKLLGIVASFGLLFIILLTTYETVCFNLLSLISSYILLVYIIIVEILTLLFR